MLAARIEIDAVLTAPRETSAVFRALALQAHLARDAGAVAGTAIGATRLRIDARRATEREPGETFASSVRAKLPLHTAFTAIAAVVDADRRIDAAAVTDEQAVRALAATGAAYLSAATRVPAFAAVRRIRVGVRTDPFARRRAAGTETIPVFAGLTAPARVRASAAMLRIGGNRGAGAITALELGRALGALAGRTARAERALAVAASAMLAIAFEIDANARAVRLARRALLRRRIVVFGTFLRIPARRYGSSQQTQRAS